ncbi:DNA-3-methyladenine glycosylase [Achromobacter sp. B7]|nr:DNA-3-methyladenine glycosylase [Achromobacter sp. B7]
MNSDEILATMILRSPPPLHFGDWADILDEYASCLERCSGKLDAEELDRLLEVGAMFYRTLARAEAYRKCVITDP